MLKILVNSHLEEKFYDVKILIMPILEQNVRTNFVNPVSEDKLLKILVKPALEGKYYVLEMLVTPDLEVKFLYCKIFKAFVLSTEAFGNSVCEEMFIY